MYFSAFFAQRGIGYCVVFVLGCAVIFASKRNEAKRKRNFFATMRCDAFFACFASMRNVEIWSKTEMEQSENKTKKKRKTAIIIASKRNEVKRKWNFFRFNAKKVFFRLFSHLKRNENEIKRKQNEKEAKTSKRKRIKWNSGTICKETKKYIKAGLLVLQVYT